MPKLRAVNVSKMVYDQANRKYVLEPDGNAVFHQWGEECDGDNNAYTMAIIEREDGQVQMVSPSFIKFIDPMVVEFLESELEVQTPQHLIQN